MSISGTYPLIFLTIVTGLSLGLINMSGILPVAGVLSFLLCCLLILIFKKIYDLFIIIGIVLLSCVFFEPSPSDFILAALIPMGLLTGAYQPQFQRKTIIVIIILMSYFIVCLPGITAAIDQAASLRYYLITFYLYLACILVGTYSNAENIISIQRAYIIAALISFIAGAAGYFGFYSDILMADSFRVKGMFKDPNVFGPFFIPAILILVDDIKNRRILKTPAIFHLIVIVMLTSGVIFSFSRAAWINLIASVFIYFFLSFKYFKYTQKIKVIVAIMVLIFIFVCLLFSPIMEETGIKDFLKERAQLQSYDNYRFNAHHGGIELILENPFGYGPGQFVNEIVNVTDYKIDAHSLYIRTAVEHGIAGFILFFSAITYLLLELFINRYKSNILSPVVVLAILCGLLVNSIVVDTIHWRHFWIFIGFGICCLNNIGKEKAESVSSLH